jgi:prepilin-type N-terminal cleavage/methylation domain-containing protein
VTLRWRRVRPTAEIQTGDDQSGFTLIEMIVALTLMASVLLTLAFALFGAMNGLVATRQRSAFVEIANGEMENLRALSYDAVGVASNDTSATYDPGPTYEGRDAVIVASGAPPAVSNVTSSLVKGIVLPYKVRRWVTWTDTFGGTAHQFKRLNVEVEWKENNRSTRKLMLTSVLYPGGGVGLAIDNQAPTAVMADPSPATGPTGTEFSFDGTGSSDPDTGDSIATYAWNFGDGITGSGPTVTHIYALDGIYTVTLTVVDSRGLTSSPVSRNVGVGSLTNTSPTASFTFGPTSGTAPLTATFTSTSTDAEGAIASWDWDWGDSTAHGSTEQATHVYESAGTFTVRLTVTDAGGLTGSTTATIQVNPLNCDVTGGSFKNPSSNTVINDVKVSSGSNKPANRSFSFTATTNSACTSVTARLPYDGGILTVSLSRVSGTNTWTGSGSVGGNDRFNVGNNQNATMTGSDGTYSDTLTYPFNVHT